MTHRHFTELEDDLIRKHVLGRSKAKIEWAVIAAQLCRTSSSVHNRYMNYLIPGIKKQNLTTTDKSNIKKLVLKHGMKWALIGKTLNISPNVIKNYHYSSLRKIQKPVKALTTILSKSIYQDLMPLIIQI